MERQTIYGWPVVIDLFLAGSGAGAFLTGFAMDLAEIPGISPGIILLAGPLLVLAGAVFLLADITIRRRVCRLFANRKSWTSRGAWILTIFIVSGAAYASATPPLFLRSPFLNRELTAAAGIVAAVFSLFVILYPGLLMSTIRAVPFWNTPLLPVLFLFAGLSNGLAFALLIILGAFMPGNGGAPGVVLQPLGGAAAVLILLQAAAFRAFLARASRGTIAARESLRLLTLSRFPRKMFFLGLFVPLVLFLGGIFTGQGFLLSLSSLFAALLLLAGGLYLRYAITQAGMFLPRFTI